MTLSKAEVARRRTARILAERERAQIARDVANVKRRYGRVCSVCSHPECSRIELEMAAGRIDRHLAKEFGVHRDAIRRHWLNHVSPTQKAMLVAGPAQFQQLAKRAALEGKGLLDYANILRSQLFEIFLDAKKDGKVGDASNVAGRIINSLDFIARLTGEMKRACNVIRFRN
jgi:hypothetical protein